MTFILKSGEIVEGDGEGQGKRIRPSVYIRLMKPGLFTIAFEDAMDLDSNGVSFDIDRRIDAYIASCLVSTLDVDDVLNAERTVLIELESAPALGVGVSPVLRRPAILQPKSPLKVIIARGRRI